METKTYYVIKPSVHHRKKVTYGDVLELVESQARPLRHGGFISSDKSAAMRIGELVIENEKLKFAEVKVKEKTVVTHKESNDAPS